DGLLSLGESHLELGKYLVLRGRGEEAEKEFALARKVLTRGIDRAPKLEKSPLERGVPKGRGV
ncbi:MAG: hypothetical protein QME51_11830, partial [Planctomycetota bacterium]|nr:hypothetical protein [Planctomycetota bacterium]